MAAGPQSSMISVTGSSLTTPLIDILMGDEIQPGSDPSYQLCKTLFTHHPLGQKMAEAPITKAQSQDRKLTVQNAPDEVVREFVEERTRLGVDGYIKNVGGLARVYGIASVALGCKGKPSDLPLEMDDIWKQDIYFNVLDPLNTAGSLVLSQVPTSADFNKPVRLATNGETFHPSRYRVLMNESPIYLSYTASAFGFVGRSVYQRALFPLKSFIRSMIADDLILTKLALLVAKQKAPGSILDNVMSKLQGLKRAILKEAQTGQVISIDTEEAIETLNMQNVDGAGTFARTNNLKNIATAADMPAKLLENETMVAGFGEGTEDAKHIAEYGDSIRKWLQAVYAWFDNIVMYRAWNPDFFARMQALYPEAYRGRDYRDVFSEWRRSFAAEWPSLLKEPESEQVKVEAVKLEALVAIVQTLFPHLDPHNKGLTIQWLADTVSENKRLFPHELILDIEALIAAAEEDKKRTNEAQDASAEEGGKKFPKFDSAHALESVRRAIGNLPPSRREIEQQRRAQTVR